MNTMPDPFKIVSPVTKLIVECPCGCGALSDAPFKDLLWVAAKEDCLFFGAPKGPRGWMFRFMVRRVPQLKGRLRIVVMKRARLLCIDDAGFVRIVTKDAAGPLRFPAQEEIDRIAGYSLQMPPPGVSVVAYAGPLVTADPPHMPRIELSLLAVTKWTLTD